MVLTFISKKKLLLGRIHLHSIIFGRIRGFFYDRILTRFADSGRDEDPDLAKKLDPGLCTSNEGRILKFFKSNVLDNFKSLLFSFHTCGVRRPL